MSKHTPGPWMIREQRTPKGELRTTRIVGADDVYVSELTGNDTKANARLIAAAPELLDALKLSIELIRPLGLDELGAATQASNLVYLRSVIKKAEGK